MRDNAMRTILAKFCFCYGVVISALGLSLMSGWSAVGTRDQELGIGIPLLIGYAVTAILTFPVYRVRSGWDAIFEVSNIRKRASHFAIWLSILTFGAFLLMSLLVRLFSGPVSSSLVLRLIGSLLLLNGVYFVIHWAYRPENVFARSTLILLNNLPLALFSARYRRNAAKAR
jgi:hypothetical protein